jgi:hypothetical protein
MKGTGYTKEHGQVLVILAIIMIGLMAMLALGLDIGNVLTKRRAAQNAADAGALAGADVWCSTQDSGAAWSAANTYATSYNEANTADIFIPASPDTGLITVTTHIPVDTYFAGVAFDAFKVITATATASAGCFSSCAAEHVLPVAWNCRPTVDGLPTPVPGETWECNQEIITLDTLQNDYALESPPEYHPELYIIMDNISYETTCDPINDPDCTLGGDFYCKEDYPGYGELTCDVDGDGKVDWLGAGGRSWIDLDGSGPGNPNDCSVLGGDPSNLTDSGSAELGYWIENGFGCTLQDHTWVSEVTGVSTDLFHDALDRMNNYPWVTLPVFDDFCIGSPDVPDGTCVGKVHGNDEFRLDPANSPTYFHIINFSYFYITCVTLNVGSHCPGVERLKDVNPDMNLNNMKAIEGYFVEGFDPDLIGRCEGIGTGAYQIYLAK